MSHQAIVNFSLPIKATTSWSTNRLIGFDGAQASVKGQKVLGAAHTDAEIGQEADVDIENTVLVEVGAPVSKGDSLISDNEAQAIRDDGAAGNYIWADALESASMADQVIEAITRR